ncbi:MAG: hydantoinase B/oxoprolinase family protein [Thermodesulfobacteriota bacterium]
METIAKKQEGICWKGRKLKDLLGESERLYEETGCYYGLEKLKLHEDDPLKLELLFSRLLAATVAGREATRMISGSPLVREVAELATALYTAEGDCVLQSTGIIIHIPLMGQVIKYMISQNYEEVEGINEGDIFTSNDNAIAGMHPPDVYDICPIFWQGKLIAWAATVIMEAELGAISPGCMPSAATERFVDGLRFSAEKTGVNDEFLPSVIRRIRFSTRLPDLFILDRKGALGANVKVREEIKEVAQEFGVEYFLEGAREIIEMERRAQLNRVRTRTVPGKLHSPVAFENYMTRTFVPPHHAIDQVTLVPMDFFIKPDGKYFLDLDGAGPWGWHPSNTTPSSMTGAMCLALTQTIAYTGSANHGTILCADMNLPYDTYVNPSSPNIATQNLFSFPINGGSVWIGLQSRAFFSRGFVEECMVGSPGTALYSMAGKDHMGNDFGFLMTDVAGTHGSGAFAIRDGFSSYAIWQPVTDMGNCEIWELILPLIWTGRNLLPDGCGWGKYRSGFAIVGNWMIYKTPLLVFDCTPVVMADKIYPNTGTHGGYPAVGPFYKLVTNANTDELIKEMKPLAHGMGYPGKGDIEENIKGKFALETSRGVTMKDVSKHGDWIQLSYGSQGGGFGDPIKRDVKLIKRDLDNRLITIDACRKIHCAEANYDRTRDEWIIDDKKTEQLRKEKIRARLKKGIPVKEWYKNRRKDILQKNMPDLIKTMYNGSLEKGKRWPGEFRAFWGLPENFTF